MPSSAPRQSLRAVAVSGILMLACSLGLVALLFWTEAPRHIERHLTAGTAGIILSLAVHEIGHLSFAMAAGLRLVSFGIGPACLLREGARLRFRLQPNLLLWGGFAVAAAPKDSPVRTGQMLAYVIGGPLTSALAGLGASALGMLAAPQHWIAGLAFGLGLGSYAIGLVTLLPIPPAPGITSDGSKLRSLIRGGPVARQLLEEYRIASAYALGGVPAQDVNSSSSG